MIDQHVHQFEYYMIFYFMWSHMFKDKKFFLINWTNLSHPKSTCKMYFDLSLLNVVPTFICVMLVILHPIHHELLNSWMQVIGTFDINKC
jgi:hypothetical protein